MSKVMKPSDWKEAGQKILEAVSILTKVREKYPLPRDLSKRLWTAEDKAENLGYEFQKKWNEFQALCKLGS